MDGAGFDDRFDDRAEELASARAGRWAATMSGHARTPGAPAHGLVRAHADSHAVTGCGEPLRREEREAREAALLASNATRAVGAGNRAFEEAPDPFRTCFERDRDRILHDSAFRRLAGKTQVFVFPDDHQRTRMTHALEVAQVARSIATALDLNVPLVEAMAIGHDCGHGPGGHASEDALSPFLDGGFDHAPWGADITLLPLNLCAETLDGIRNHSWSLPAPHTPEGEVVSWADRIAYVCHDFEDAVAAGIVTTEMLPSVVAERCGRHRSRQLGTFIRAVIAATRGAGEVGMDPDTAEALAEFRRFNYEHVYLRPASRRQAEAVIALLRALVEFYADRPHAVPVQTAAAALGLGPRIDATPGVLQVDAGGTDAVRIAVAYVAGMTDRFACQQGVAHLDWDPAELPAGIGI
jgi:dGTPase